jgi:hypothetical protein
MRWDRRQGLPGLAASAAYDLTCVCECQRWLAGRGEPAR